MSTKKQKILVSICTPVAVASLAGGVTAIILANKNSVLPTKGDYKLSFNTGSDAYFVDDTGSEQKVYDKTPLYRVVQPKVASYRGPNYLFAGWKDENGNRVPGTMNITKDTNLTASFGNTSTGDYAVVTFKRKPGEEDVELNGNVSVAIDKGTTFLMVNRPTASWGDNYFESWQTLDSSTGEYTTIQPSTVINSDITLYANFTKAVTVTWLPGDGGMISRGQSTTKLSSGTAFGKFNQPQLMNSDLNKVFEGWYHVDDSGKATTKWSETELVESNAQAIAGWTSGTISSDAYHLLQFVQNDTSGQPTVVFAPSTSTIVASNSTWETATKPTVYTTDGNYELDSWQYYDDTTSAWTTLTPSYQFVTSIEAKKTSTRIRPVMKSSISSITLYGKDTVLPESGTQYLAVVNGTDTNPNVQQNVTWTLWSDEACTVPFDANKATITGGLLTVKSLTKSETVWIKATSSIKNDVTQKKAVLIQMPYVESQRIWYHTGTQWMSISQKEGLCDGTATTIKATPLNSAYGSEKTLNKADTFTYKLYIGRQLTTVFSQFGYNWTGFNAEIDFGENIRTIQSSFLENCINFNSKLDLSNVTKIGDKFLKGCTAFGTPDTSATEESEKYAALLTLNPGTGTTKLLSIGDNFLAGCTSYNRDLVLPTNGSYTIGDSFLYNCTSFNRDITIPANITSIEDFFMFNCNAYTSTIYVENDVSTSMVQNINSIASAFSGSAIYTTGFKVDGTYASTFKSMFPTNATYNAYRTIDDGSGKTEVKPNNKDEAIAAAEKVIDIENIANLNYTVDMSMHLAGTNSAGSAVEQTYSQQMLIQGQYTQSNGETVPLMATTSDGSVGNYFLGAGSAFNNTYGKYKADGTIKSGYESPLPVDKTDIGSTATALNVLSTSDVTQWTYNSETNQYISPKSIVNQQIDSTVIPSTLYLEFERDADTNELRYKQLIAKPDEGFEMEGLTDMSTSYVFSEWGTTVVPLPEAGFTKPTMLSVETKDTTITGGTNLVSDQWTSVADTPFGVGIKLSNLDTSELAYKHFQLYFSTYDESTSTWGDWTQYYMWGNRCYLIDATGKQITDATLSYDYSSRTFTISLATGVSSFVFKNTDMIAFNAEFVNNTGGNPTGIMKMRVTFSE